MWRVHAASIAPAVGWKRCAAEDGISTGVASAAATKHTTLGSSDARDCLNAPLRLGTIYTGSLKF